MSERVPAALAAAIKSDIGPVHRLSPPMIRVLWLVPLALLTLVAASRVFSFRGDADLLGWLLTWGSSTLQALVALALIALALHDAVPGRTLRTSLVLSIAGAALGMTAVITLRTWSVSPIQLRGLGSIWIGEICFAGTIATALPLLVAAAVMTARAFTVRPWSAGALYGLGAGIGADAGWRLFCHYSDPAHVFPTHTGAVVVTMVLGMIIARLWSSVSGLRSMRDGH